MDEENKETPKDKYIKCSQCNCKYINDEENINTDFGYNRLKERYKTCCKCRDKKKQYLNDNPKQRENIKTYNDSVEAKTRRKLYDSVILFCPTCNRQFPKSTMYQHRRSHSPTFWANKK